MLANTAPVPVKFNVGVFIVVAVPLAVTPFAIVTLPAVPLVKVKTPALVIFCVAVIVPAATVVVATTLPLKLEILPNVRLPVPAA